MDTATIMNPRVRELVDAVVVRLDQSFDGMLARIVEGGVYVALAEFVGQHGDGAPVVRALHDANLIAIDGATAGRRVVRENIGGAELTGVVLSASALHGYAEWARHWQGDGAG
jgi:hypothetical protein